LQVIAIIIAALALLISAITAWLTLLMRGTIKMTRPSVIYFGPDGGPKAGSEQKVYLRTLLFSTSKRGRVIEAMYVALRRNESKRNFNIWVYGDERLVRGSGLFVDESGIAVSHHFLAPTDNNHFKFSEGTYHLEVFVKLLGDKETLLLFSQELIVDHIAATALANEDCGLYFDWGPDARRYIPHLDKRRRPFSPDDFLEALAMGRALPNKSTPSDI